MAYDAQTGVANRGNGRRRSPNPTRQSRLPQALDGVVYALTHQPTAQATSLRILRRARVDIQYGHVGIFQDGTESPGCIRQVIGIH